MSAAVSITRSTVQFLAQLFGSFVLYAATQARQEGFCRIFYLSREGRFFHRIHQQLDKLGLGPLPPAFVLQASRLSTFPASLFPTPSLQLFDRFVSMYRLSSLEDFLRSSGLARGEEAVAWAARFPGLAAFFDSPASSREKLRFLLSHRDFYVGLTQRIAEHHANLIAYLKTLDVHRCRSVYVVDIGWAGSIQDNLARACPGTLWRGSYLVLRQSAALAPYNSIKDGFLFDARTSGHWHLERRLRFVKPLELAVTGSGGTTIGYRRDDEGVVPILLAGPDEAALTTLWAPLQQAIIAELASVLDLIANFNSERAQLLRRTLHLISHPPLDLMNLYLRTPRDEVFGEGLVRPALTMEGELGDAGFIARIRTSGWPQAVLAQAFGKVLAPVGLAAFAVGDRLHDLITSHRT